MFEYLAYSTWRINDRNSFLRDSNSLVYMPGCKENEIMDVKTNYNLVYRFTT